MTARPPTILWVTYGLPYPPHSGARLRDFHLLTRVARWASVRLLCLLEFPEEAALVAHLRPYCASIDVIAPTRRTSWREGREVARWLLTGRPLATYAFHEPALAARLGALMREHAIDAVQIEHSFLAPYVENIPTGHPARRLLSLHNLGASQYRQMWRLRGQLSQRLLFVFKWLLMLGWEVRYAGRFDRVLAVSSLEGERLRAANPRLRVAVVENGVDTRQHQLLAAPSSGNDVLFVGTMGYRPNVDAVLSFHEEILPLVRRVVPDARLVVVGRHPAAEVRRLAASGDVVVTGAVDDVTPFYERARVVVAPLRAGGGTRLKILEAMALGRPVVSTSLGCEGLAVVDGRDLLIADEPGAFAAAVVSLLTDPARCAALTTAARRTVEAHHDWEVIGDRLAAVYRELLAPGPVLVGFNRGEEAPGA